MTEEMRFALSIEATAIAMFSQALASEAALWDQLTPEHRNSWRKRATTMLQECVEWFEAEVKAIDTTVTDPVAPGVGMLND